MSALCHTHTIQDSEHNLRVKVSLINEDDDFIHVELQPVDYKWGVHSTLFLTADAAREVAQALLAAVEKMEDEPGDRPACQILGGPHHQDDGRGMCRYCGDPI